MPENGNDIFLCNFDYDAAHLCRVSRLPAQLILKAYHKVTFERPLKRSDIKSSSALFNLLKEQVDGFIRESSIETVFITIPTSIGYVDSYRKEVSFQNSDNRELGKFLLQNASSISPDKLNFDVVKKNHTENWIFSLEKKIAAEIQDLFSKSGLKTGAILLNAVVLENYLESIPGDETKMLMDFSNDFAEIWVLNESKSVSVWKMITTNDLVNQENSTFETRISNLFKNLQSQFSIRIRNIYYSGLKAKNDINQLFQSNSQFNFTEATIRDIVKIDPNIAERTKIERDNSYLIKIAGTTLSIN